MSTEEKAWLVERANHDGMRSPMWLMACGTLNISDPSASLEWTPTALKAIRFSRQQDATLFIGVIRTLSNYLMLGHTLKGLRDGDTPPMATEHIFII